ncbi:MAG: nucleotidyltransferase domain-containing protein [Nanoarchaeota archaeon]
MLKETELKILSSFFPEGKEITLKKVMERTSLSYEPVYRNIRELEREKIISSMKFGKTLVYSLNFEKEEAKIAFFFYAKDRLKELSNKYKTIFNALSKIDKENMDFLAIFGSYAKGNPTKESDVDIICVSLNKKDDEQELRSLSSLTNLEFNPVVLPKSEFKKIKKENDVFWNDLVKFGIIFKGYELFYSEAYLK